MNENHNALSGFNERDPIKERGIVEHTKQLRADWTKSDIVGASEAIAKEADRLKFFFGKDHVQQYAMWHVLAGSTVSEELFGDCPYFDFPDNNSVELFFQRRGK